MYISWKCPDLNNEVLYAAERMPNPDSPSYALPATCTMIDRAKAFNIIEYFFSNIVDALTNQQDYTTGIIRLCRFMRNAELIDYYYQWQALVSGSDQTVTIRFGYGDGSTFSSTPTSRVYTYNTFMSMPESEKCISIIYFKGREYYNEAQAPGWDGWTHLDLVCGQVQKRVGTYEAPSTSYPYGRKVYAFSSYGNISDIPGGTIMCYSDNAESRALQSSLAAYLLGPDNTNVSIRFQSDTTLIPCAYDGSYDQNTEVPDPNENDPSGPSGPGGGGGNHDKTDDPIPIPDLPDLSVTDAGMITLYKLTTIEMQTFTDYLFLNITQPGGLWAQLKNLFADPLDFIIGLRILPFTPSSTRRAKPKFGSFEWPNAYDVVTSGQWRELDFGDIDIPEYWGSAFDYEPYTRIQIFLPGIGFRELPVDDVMGKTVGLKYHCDCFTGDCVAFVYTPSVGAVGPQKLQVIAQFGGNLGYTVPLARVSYDSAIQTGITLMSRALGFATNAFMQATGDSTDVSAGTMVESTTMQLVNAQKRTVERSGAAGGGIGYMSSQRPYIVKTLPRQSIPTGYKDIEGYPANLSGPLSTYRNSGYTQVEKITLTGINATIGEKEEIEKLLKGGVFI